MRLILDVGYPRDEAGVAAFDANVKAAKECGAVSLHAAMTARRYEYLSSLDGFKQDFEKCQKSIALAEPVLRKHRLRLGIENHKGWRSRSRPRDEAVVGSEWVGVHSISAITSRYARTRRRRLRNLLRTRSLPHSRTCGRDV